MKIGAFTFGGGWAMIPLIEKEVVEHKKWQTREEFIDALAVAQSLPGVLAVNISILVGNKLRGVRGSLAATLGTIAPSFFLILIIAIYLSQVYDNEIVVRVFMGIRPAVVALIVSPVLSTAKSAKIGWRNVWIPVVSALLIWQAEISPILFVLLGIVGGILYNSHLTSKQLKK